MRIALRGFSVAILLAGMLCSCQEEFAPIEQPEINVNMVAAEFTAVTEAGLPTKMTLGTGLKPKWEKGDRLAVYGGGVVTEFAVKNSEGSLAKFDGQVAEGSEEFYALFPYAEGVGFDNSAKAFTKAVIPSEQVISQGDSVSASALMGMSYVQKPAEGIPQFTFRNVCGLIKVVVPESGKIASIVIRSNNEGERFVGEGTVSFRTETVGDAQQRIPVFVPGEGALNTVTLRPEGENATFEKGNYYAAVAPVRFEGGFSVSLVRTDGAAGTIGTTEPMEVVRNGGTNLKDVVSISDWTISITTKEQLLAWNANYGMWKKTDYVELGADIDLEGEEWEPHNFLGTFDGKGHKIYNISVVNSEPDTRIGFFGELKGNVSNLILGSKDGLEYDGKSNVTVSASTASYWVYVGSLAGLISTANVVVENVKSFVSLEIASAFTKKCVVGGLVGYANVTGINLKNCVNNGSIAHNAADASDNKCPIGGIVGKVDYGINITSCENNGKIENNCPKVRWIGGIMGATNGYEANASISGAAQSNSTEIAVISKCKNTAAIGASNGVDLSIGGIVGLIAGAQIEECVNTGMLEYSLADKAYVGGIAGRFSGDLDSSVSKCENGLVTDSSKGSVQTNGTNTSYVGGIVGFADAYANAKFTFTDCKNYANLTTTNSNVAALGGFGGQISAGACTFTIDKCYNYGAISNNCTSEAGNNHVAGFVANFGGKDVNSTVISNSENWGNVTSVKPSTARPWVGGFFGQITKSKLENLVNNASVSLTNSKAKSAVGGIAGNAASSCEVINADNAGAVTMNKSAENSYSAGVVAVLQGSTATDCDNTGKVQILGATNNESNAAGIFAYGNNGVTLTGCTNSGEIFSSGEGTNYIGGIAAYNAGGTITFKTCYNKKEAYVHCERGTGVSLMGGILGWSTGISNFSSCTNDGGLMHVTNGTDYYAAGGIIGRSRGVTIENCVNTGTVEGVYNTSNQLANAGGIIGVIAATTAATDAVQITNNVNGSSTDASLGRIVSTNKYASQTAYAGGIVGGDNESTVDATTTHVITGNKNYGTVTAAGNGVTLGTSGAGGIIGTLRRIPSSFSDNTSYGNVSASGATMVAAGAICGYMESTTAAISSVAYTGLAVNGMTKAEAEAAGKLDLWLCGSSKGGTVTANYVDAPEAPAN